MAKSLRRPVNLTHHQLATIVRQVQSILWRDDETAEVNEEKEHSADTTEAIVAVLVSFGLDPKEEA